MSNPAADWAIRQEQKNHKTYSCGVCLTKLRLKSTGPSILGKEQILHFAARQACRPTNEALLLRNGDNRHEIIVSLGWHDLHQARTFSQSVSLQMAMKLDGGGLRARGAFFGTSEARNHCPTLNSMLGTGLPSTLRKLPDAFRGSSL